MHVDHTQFTFDESVAMSEVAGTLALARLAAESLHGRERLEMEASASVDEQSRCVRISGASEVARSLAVIFLGYARHEFGTNAVRVGAPAEPCARRLA
jgi:hypothetical protein